MIFLIDSKSILDCSTYNLIRLHQFDIVVILEYFKQKFQQDEFKEESKILDKLKTLADVLFNSNKSQILRLLNVFTYNSTENKQIFEAFQSSSCSQWFIEQLYIEQIQIIFQQYIKNDQQFIGKFLKKIMNLYELDLQIQNGQYKNKVLQDNNINKVTASKQTSLLNDETMIQQDQINISKQKIENNIKQIQKDDQHQSNQVIINSHHTNKNTNNKQQNYNQEINQIQSNKQYNIQQGQGSTILEQKKQSDQITNLISNIINKKSINSENVTEEQQVQLNNHDQKEINKQHSQVNYQIPENEQQNITISQYTRLEEIYELLENKYNFDSWWPEFKAQCNGCKNKEDFFHVLNQKVPILMGKWIEIAEKQDSDIYDESDQEKQDKLQVNNSIVFQEQDKNNILDKSQNTIDILDKSQNKIDIVDKQQIQIQSQGNQTESNNLQNNQLLMNQELIYENRFSQDFNDSGLFEFNLQQNFENSNNFEMLVHSPSKQSSVNSCSDKDNFIFNKGNEEFHNSNQSQSDSIILDEDQTKKSLITNLEQFYKSKLVENQPQHIVPELEYMGNTQKMVDKLLFYLDFDNLDIQIEDFLAQPQINPSKILQEFVLTSYNIIKYITIHKYITIIEVKQIEKEYLGSVIISQVNNKNKDVKKYKGPRLDIVNIITRLIAIKKLNNNFFSEGIECTSLFQIVMSIIKRLIPNRGLYKEIVQKYKKIKTPSDKVLDKIVIINQTQKQNQQSNAKTKYYQKKDDQIEFKNKEIKQTKNKRSINNNNNVNQYQNVSNQIFPQNNNNDQNYSLNQSNYTYNHQNQYSQNYQQIHQYLPPFQYKNQPCQQGYQGQSKNQQQYTKFYQQSTQGQYEQNIPFNLNYQQYFNFQNNIQRYPFFDKKTYKHQKEFYKLHQQPQDQFHNYIRLSNNQQYNQYDQINQQLLRGQSQQDYTIKKKYHQQNQQQNIGYQDQQQFNQQFNQSQYNGFQPQNNQSQIDFQIIQKMVSKLMGETTQ